MELCALEYVGMEDLGYFHSKVHGIVLLVKLALEDLTLFTCIFHCWTTNIS
jgi:hypothetical protein